ncbi:hypothetical protein C8E84_1673 [Ornithinibacter aureus]|nr:hypothetical protein C8E84_1673 [Ornithinibacter aureus]
MLMLDSNERPDLPRSAYCAPESPLEMTRPPSPLLFGM